MFNPFNGSKATIFDAIVRTEDENQRAKMAHQVLNQLPDELADKIYNEMSSTMFANAMGAFLHEIFSPKKKKPA